MMGASLASTGDEQQQLAVGRLGGGALGGGETRSDRLWPRCRIPASPATGNLGKLAHRAIDLRRLAQFAGEKRRDGTNDSEAARKSRTSESRSISMTPATE